MNFLPTESAAPEVKLTVAIFFAAGEEPARVTTKGVLKAQSTSDHFRQLELVFRSLRRFHPNSRAVLLTDLATPTTGLTNIEVVRTPVNMSQLVWDRMKAQREFVETLGQDELCLFLDSDMLINRPLSELFSMGGDVLLTWRPKRRSNFINGGFIGVRGAKRQQAIHFFDHVQGKFRELFWQQRAWGGDQYALCATFAGISTRPENTSLIHLDDADVVFLPCSQWNWSPANTRRSAILRPQRSPRILHFKGGGKRLMHDYWHLYHDDVSPPRFARLWLQVFLGAVFDQCRTPPGSKARWRILIEELKSHLIASVRKNSAQPYPIKEADPDLK